MQCVKTFRRFEKTHRHGVISVRQGFWAGREGHIDVRDTYDFNEPARSVADGTTDGYKRVRVSRPWLLQTFCQPPIDTAKLEASGAKDNHAWMHASRRHWMTIRDVEKLAPGERLKVLLLDRNVWDTACSANMRGRSYAPSHFFRNHVATLVAASASPSEATLFQNVTTRNVRTGKDTSERLGPWGMHVEYESGSWYPLQDGVLPVSDPSEGLRLLGQATPWARFPKSTHVGSRGPMIAWNHVTHALPRIFSAADM